VGVGRDDVSGLLQTVAVLLGVATAGFAIAALVAGYQAVRIGGARLLFNGWDWFVMSDRVPVAARPLMRKALWRWCCAAGCMVMAAIAGALSGRPA
jgi:hypothetical protein